MSEFWQGLLTQIVVALVSGAIGGGLISTYLDWRRFRREEAEIEKEEQRIAIDTIRSVISVNRWKITDKMDDKLKLYIYQNNLNDSVQEYAIVAEFVIRNLTDDEVIITRLEVEEPGMRPFEFVDWDNEQYLCAYSPDGTPFIRLMDTDLYFYDMQGWYDWKTKEEKTETEYITLQPKGTARFARVVVRRFFAPRKLDSLPQIVIVTAHSTEEHKVTKELKLNNTERLFRILNHMDKYQAPIYSPEWFLKKERDEMMKQQQEQQRLEQELELKRLEQQAQEDEIPF